MSVKARHATIEDFPACQLFDSRLIESQFLKDVREDKVIVVEKGGKVRGYLCIDWFWARYPYLRIIFVEDGYRGGGLGNRMLEFLEKALSKKGFKQLLSSSQLDENLPQHWHRKNGFEECGILSGINEGGVGEVFFKKAIG